MTRAVAFDLDGTLAESKSPLAPEMGTLVTELAAKMPVAVMSGGSYTQFQEQFLVGIPANGFHNLYLFPTSAAQCLVWRDNAWKYLYDNELTPAEKTRVTQTLDEALRETGLNKPPPQLWGAQTEDRGSQISWSGLGQEAPIEAKQKWDPDKLKRGPLQKLLVERLPEFSVRANAMSTIDITKKGITKAYGVRRWSEIINIPVGEMLYVGDALFSGGNDEVVKETGIATRQVAGPAQTAQVIEELLG
ncbi:MAG: HAD-IIB family hydrolase [Minisyncoccia bacterium]